MAITNERVESKAGTDEALLRHALHASSAMRASGNADHILGVLTATAQLLVPAAGIWAGRRHAGGSDVSQSVVFDAPSVSPRSINEHVAVEMSGFLDRWAARLGEGSPPFELDLADTPFATVLQHATWSTSVLVFPMSSSIGRGALIIAAPFESPASTYRSIAALLCNHASMALDATRARAAAEHTDALNSTLTQLTASYEDAEVVLQTIVRSTANLLGTDAAFVMLADESMTRLTVKTAYGITSKRFFEASCATDELLPGAAIRTRRVVCVRDMSEFGQSKHSKPEGLRSVMCAPMFVEDQLVGVLLAAHRCIHEPSEDDRRLMAALASAAAISIGNARLYADRERSIARLSEVNRLLEQRSTALERTMAFQQRVTALVLEGHGLADIAASLADALGRSILVLDRDLSVVSPRESELPHGLDLASLREAVTAVSEGSTAHELCRASVRAGDRAAPVLVAPLELGAELVAYVVIVEGSTKLDRTDVGIATSGVTAIGLELMRDRATAEAEARLTGGLFQALLSGDSFDEATISRRASYLGYKLSGVNVAIAARHANPRPGDTVKLEACVRRSLRRRDDSSAVFERDDAVYVVLSDADDITPAAIDEHCALIRQELAIAGRTEGVRIAFAGPHRGINGVKQAVIEAAHALHVQELLGRSGSVSFDDLGVWALLGRIDDRAHLTGFASTVLGPLVDHDAEHSSDLVLTLRELVARNYHYRSAAETLFAHPNTLRYRMTRIAELTGIDFTNADDRLRVELALRIHDLFGAPTERSAPR